MADGGTNLGTAHGFIEIDHNIDAAVRSARTAFRGAIDGMTGQMQQLGGAVSSLGVQLTLLTAPLVFAMKKGVTAALDFESSITNVAAIMGLTTDEAQALHDKLLAFSAGTRAGPQAVADAYVEIAGGVADASTHFAILEAAVAASEAGNADLAGTTGAMVAVMNSYGLSAEKAGYVSDVLTRTVGMGVGSMDEFGQAMGLTAGMAAANGISFDQLGTAMAFLTTQGVSASEAGTQITGIMSAMLNPNEKMKDAFKELGWESGQAALEMYGLAGVTGRLEAAFGADALAPMLGNLNALRGATALNQASFEDFIGTFADGVEGATDMARAIQNMSRKAKLEKFTAQINRMAITFGEALFPAIDQVLTAVEPLILAFTTWLGENSELVSQIALLVVAIAGVGAAAAAGGAMVAALGGILAFLLSPVVLLIGAAAALALAWRENFLGIRAFVEQIGLMIQSILPAAGAFVSTLAGKVGEVGTLIATKLGQIQIGNTTVGALATEIRSTIEQAFNQALEAVGSIFSGGGAAGGVGSLLNDGMGNFAGPSMFAGLGASIRAGLEGATRGIASIDTTNFRTWVNDNLKTLADAAVNLAGVVFGGPFSALLGIAKLVQTAIENDFLGLGTLLEQSGIGEAIKSGLQTVQGLIQGAIDSIFGGGAEGPDFSGVGGQLNDGMGNFAGAVEGGGILGRIGKDLEAGLNFIKNIFARIGPGIQSGLENFFSGVQGFFEALAGTDTEGLYEVVRVVGGVLGGLATFVATAAGTALETALNVLGDLLPAFGTFISNVIEAIGSIGKGDIGGVLRNLGEGLLALVSGLLTVPENIGNGVISLIEKLTGKDLPSIADIIEDIAGRVKVAIDDMGRFFTNLALTVELAFLRVAESVNRSLYNVTVLNDPANLLPDVQLDTALIGKVMEMTNAISAMNLGETIRGAVDTALTAGGEFNLDAIVLEQITVGDETFVTDTLRDRLESMGNSPEAWAAFASTFGEGGKRSIEQAMAALLDAGNWEDFELMAPLAVELGIDLPGMKATYWQEIFSALNNTGVDVNVNVEANPLVRMAQDVGNLISGLLGSLNVTVPVNVTADATGYQPGKNFDGSNDNDRNPNTPFFKGGYTGDGPAHEEAGVVHRGEFVLSRDMLRNLAGISRGGGGSSRKVAEQINIYANTETEGIRAAQGFEDELYFLQRS